MLTPTTSRPDLGPAFAGDVVVPGDPAYDELRAVFNAMVDRRPALVARCRTTADVAAALSYARAHDLPVAVRAGGHNVVGFAVVDDGLVIDLRPMRRVTVDAEARTARVEGGATWADVDAATQAHGLAVTGGRISHTGVAGVALGSGSGWLERKLGFTADNLLAAEVVTVEGDLVRASADEHPDLFWALRGGGGNFGVVTAFTFRLHRIGPVVPGGMALWALADAPAVVRRWRDVVQQAPDDLGTAVVVMTAPPAPFVPASLQGRLCLAMVAAWFGDPAQADAVLRPLRSGAAPAADLVEAIPYVALQQLIDPACPPGQRQYWRSESLPALGDDVLDAWLGLAAEASSPSSQFVLEPKDGACGRVPEEATPLRRTGAWTYQTISVWDDPAEDERHIAYTRAFAAAMEPHTVPGVNLNYTSDTSPGRVAATFGPEKHARLVDAKRRWDPENVLRSNRNIVP